MAGELDQRVDATLARLTLDQKVGQLFVTAVFGGDAERPGPDDEGRNLSAFGLPAPADVVRKYHLGGLVFFSWAGNTREPQRIADLSNGLQRAAVEDGAGVPLFVGVDQEQGSAVRLDRPFTEVPGSLALGASGSTRDAYEAASVTGAELAAVGVNQVYAPTVDVSSNPSNPVLGGRSYGADPDLVSRLGVAQARGFADAGVVATAKHFPGHGDTVPDGQTGVPVVQRAREPWESTDAAPFRALVEAGVDAVLTAHVVAPALDGSGDPATLSAPVVSGILRDELGYGGLVVTDSLHQRGVRSRYGDATVPVLALRAGADQLLMPPNLELAIGAVVDAVRSGELPEERIDASVRRVLRLKYARGLFDRPYADQRVLDRVVGSRRHGDSAARIADRTVTLVRDDAGAVPLDPSWQAVLVVGAGAESTAVVAEELEAYASWTCAVDTGDSPDAEAIRSAVARAKHHDVVVLLTRQAWDTRVTDPVGGQRRLLAALLGARSRVIVVAVRDPYDLAYAGEASTCLATYGDDAVAMRALSRVLVGAVEPRGTLPVELPSLT